MAYFRRRRIAAGEQVVVVTGASAGVGRAIARAFGARRAKVALVARTAEALGDAADEIVRLGGEALPLALDVADGKAVEDAAAAVVARFGRIDTWVNDAMVSVFSPALEMTADEYRRVMDVNWMGTVNGTLAALRRMMPRDEGLVIQIGSALAYRSIPLQSAYCSSKAAQRAFTDSLRTELLHARSRVRLSSVHLPAVNTPQFDVVRSRLPRRPRPVGPVYQPEMIARAVLRVAERPVRELWIGGSTWKAIVGGAFLAPGYADRKLSGKLAWDGQMTDEPQPPGRPDDVFQPLPGDRGAHGRFDAEARTFSAELAARLHPWRTALATAASAAGLAFAVRAARR
jgi:NADP-dependent 3-hydroxy acid dehydrogenase YdfG